MKRATIVKTVIWAFIFLIIGLVTRVCGAIISDNVAMTQMQINDESYAISQLYNNVTFYAPYILALICLATYTKEIKILIKFIRSKLNENN